MSRPLSGHSSSSSIPSSRPTRPAARWSCTRQASAVPPSSSAISNHFRPTALGRRSSVPPRSTGLAPHARRRSSLAITLLGLASLAAIFSAPPASPLGAAEITPARRVPPGFRCHLVASTIPARSRKSSFGSATSVFTQPGSDEEAQARPTGRHRSRQPAAAAADRAGASALPGAPALRIAGTAPRRHARRRGLGSSRSAKALARRALAHILVLASRRRGEHGQSLDLYRPRRAPPIASMLASGYRDAIAESGDLADDYTFPPPGCRAASGAERDFFRFSCSVRLPSAMRFVKVQPTIATWTRKRSSAGLFLTVSAFASKTCEQRFAVSELRCYQHSHPGPTVPASASPVRPG